MSNLLLEAGINTPVRLNRAGIDRIPLVSIRSSPGKARDEAIPWHNHFDLDLGCSDYYGDNRLGGRDGRVKSQVRFEGLAVIERCERVVQVDRTGARYGNYRFRLGLLDLADDDHRIERNWLADRRDHLIDGVESNRLAPSVWRTWLAGADVDDIRAVVGLERPSSIETAAFGSDHSSVLDVLEERYRTKPEAFTGLAAAIVEVLFRSAGLRYSTSRVHAEDGRLSGRLRLGVSHLGPASDVAGVVDLRHRATRLSPRTVASLLESLKPGVQGIVVTRQVIPVRDERFTQIVVDGRRIAQTVLQLAHRDRLDVPGVLDRLETGPDSIIGPAVAGHAGIVPGIEGE